MEWRARTVMTSPVISVPREASVEEAARILTEAGISGAPVVDARGALVGVVSRFDLDAWLAGVHGRLARHGAYYAASALRWARGDRDRDDEDEPDLEAAVDDVMTPELICVDGEAPLSDVVELMSTRRIHRVLVTDGGKATDPLLGVVTTLDVIDALAGRKRGDAGAI